MPLITHLIYDFDGLLLNTEPIYFDVYDAIARRYGKTLTPAVYRKIMGRQALDCAQILVTDLGLPLTAQAHIQLRTQLIRDRLPQAEPMPGAIALTQHFYQLGIPQAIATSSAAITFGLKTQNHQAWLAQFDAIVLGNDPEVKRSKPAPDSFLVAAQRLGANPKNCLVFEDAPAGVTAGKQAGMSVVAVPASHMTAQAYPEADQIIETLTDFDPEQWGLPRFSRPN